MVHDVAARSLTTICTIHLLSLEVVERDECNRLQFAGGATVAHVVLLRYNANDFHISSQPTHDVNFKWFTCFLEVVSDADCGAEGKGLNPGEDMDVVGGRGREVGVPWPSPGFAPSKLGGQSEIVLSFAWCSKIRLTKGVKILALSRDDFRGPRSDFGRWH
ncbi:hypothetical protein TNCV_4992591 [Trichonephila clavipes]|nr:hypothetical protein TNCV_4992591 [Trichonephila clavipes]